jgi:hypothetical protein
MEFMSLMSWGLVSFPKVFNMVVCRVNIDITAPTRFRFLVARSIGWFNFENVTTLAIADMKQ